MASRGRTGADADRADADVAESRSGYDVGAVAGATEEYWPH